MIKKLLLAALLVVMAGSLYAKEVKVEAKIDAGIAWYDAHQWAPNGQCCRWKRTVILRE